MIFDGSRSAAWGRTLTGAEIASLRALLAERYAKFDGKRSAAKWLEDAISGDGLTKAMKGYAALPRGCYRSQDELSILGQRLQGKGKTTEALAVYQAALREFPKSALMYHNLGRLYIGLGQRDSARKYFKLVLREVPGNQDAAEMLERVGNELR